MLPLYNSSPHSARRRKLSDNVAAYMASCGKGSMARGKLLLMAKLKSRVPYVTLRHT